MGDSTVPLLASSSSSLAQTEPSSPTQSCPAPCPAPSCEGEGAACPPDYRMTLAGELLAVPEHCVLPVLPDQVQCENL